MGERGIQQDLKSIAARRAHVELGSRRLEVITVPLERPLPARSLRSPEEAVLVAGLPYEVEPCSAALAYLYVAEDVLIGSRVRNKSILFAMNLLALKQAKEVVERVAEFRAIVVAGPEGEAQRAMKEVGRQIGADLVITELESLTCSPEDLERVTRGRAERL